MLPLSANPDYDNFNNTNIVNPYYDINAMFGNKIDLYGTEALDQAIENILCTEPYERLFNPDFWSPLYTILFENGNNLEDKKETIFKTIEFWVPVLIDRKNSTMKFNEMEHALEVKIFYFYDLYGASYNHTFSRIISR